MTIKYFTHIICKSKTPCETLPIVMSVVNPAQTEEKSFQFGTARAKTDTSA